MDQSVAWLVWFRFQALIPKSSAVQSNTLGINEF